MNRPTPSLSYARSLGAALRERTFAWVDRAFIPGRAALAPEELRRRRLLAVSTLLVSLSALFIGLQTLRSNGGRPDVVSGVLWGGSAVAGSTLLLLRSERLAPFAAPLFCFELAVVLAVVSLAPGGHGFWDPSVWWFAVTPLFTALLVGPRFALGAAFAVVVFLSGLYAQAPATPPTMGADASWFRLLSGTTVVFTLSGLAWLYELSRREASALVEKTLSDLQAANAQLRDLHATVVDSRDSAQDESHRKTVFFTRMRESAKAQRLALDETSAAMSEMTTTFRVIAESVSTLGDAAEECATAIQQMNALNGSAGQQIHEMVASVDHAAMSLEEMGYSVREVAQHIHGLSAVAASTATSMNEMEASVTHVQDNARATERLSDDVIQDARRGAEALRRTLEGIQNISRSSQLAGGKMRRLGGRIEDIDAILDVINEVADQTQLLSLNAAIIASQAGEHGRGFGVVASEIKKLAERTATSTREIASVIDSVQRESREALEAIAEGERAVDDGLVRSRQAEHALAEILRSAEETTRMVKAIAAATVEQTAAARAVAGEMERVASSVNQVAMVTGEQDASAEEVLAATRRMQELAMLVARASQEQLEGGQRVDAAVERIRQMVSALEQVQTDQTRGSEQVLESIEAIRESQGAQVSAIEHLDVDQLER